MFEKSFRGTSLCALKKYAAEELDPEDHFGFMEICRAFGITNKARCYSDTELIELFQRFKEICLQFGIPIEHDFVSLHAVSMAHEENCIQSLSQDRIEVEVSRQQSKAAELYIKKIQLGELLKQKEMLQKELEQIEQIREYSNVSKEVVQLAKSLNVKTSKQNAGFTIYSRADCHIDFHSYFIPFVNLSIETVNFIYEQILTIGTHPGAKECMVLLLMKYYQKRLEAKQAYLRHKTNENALNYTIALILMEKPVVGISELCRLLKRDRKEIIKSVFFLCSQKILIFNRLSDAVSLYTMTPASFLGHK
ncbi:uncharacterized protein NEMAJ01_0095 [Nematocida major]|uniref:uncharacterized protein n=1 Tax=Nematocida major TaxID=1912982 RepID=UPI0020077C80|nr:uncharacterized protein NEMAJ01_0095 [Nematocida major]KAH9385199.1 hypothetical protein NEMAJ01_0095 [Nematocida major]